MSRRILPRVLLASLGAGIVLGAIWLRERPAESASTRSTGGVPGPELRSRPDLVLVTIDTLRADALGFAGNRRVRTPTLDRLAAAGRVFTEARAHNVVTLPSHANILTGLYPFQHGVRDNSGFRLDAAVPTLATVLAAAGYRTAAFVGAFPLDSRYGLDRGFELYDDRYPRGSDPAAFVIAERRGDQVVAAALDWWRGAAGDAPRFLWVHLYDPHAAYDAPEPFASEYRDAPYLGEVAATDHFLAPLLEPLLAGGGRPALAVVTGDHGEGLGDHGEATHGLFAYDSTLRVPLVVHGAGVAPGVDARPARHIDLAPTLAAAAGATWPSRLPGRSLLAPPEPVDSYFEALTTYYSRGWAPLFGIVRERQKFIELPLPELYRLDEDPGESTNVLEREPALAAALRGAIPSVSRELRARHEPSAEESARLRSLGYLVGSSVPPSEFGAADDPKRLVAVDREIHRLIDAYSRGEWSAAAAIGRQVVAARPQMGQGYVHLALALRQMQRAREAIAVLEEGLARAGDSATLRRHLGLTLAEAGDAERARELLEPLAASDDPEALRALGIALSDSGDQARALDILTRARALDPHDPTVLVAAAAAHLRADRLDEAERLLDEALALNAELATAWNTRGVVRYRAGDPDGAIEAWLEALRRDPGLLDALFNVGLVAAERGRRDQARQALERFVAAARSAPHLAADTAKARAVLAGLGS